MNNKTIAALATAVVCCASAATRVVEVPPVRLLDIGKVPKALVRYGDTSAIDQGGRYTEPTCHYRFLDPYFGYLEDNKYEAEGKIPFNFNCYASGDEIVSDGWAKFDEMSHRWKVNLLPEDRELFEGHTRIYEIAGSNASGWAITADDSTDEERFRRRMLHYCLIHPPQALCGSGEMGYLEDITRHPENDLTPYSLKILRTIEFIDRPTAAHPAASQASLPR